MNRIRGFHHLSHRGTTLTSVIFGMAILLISLLGFTQFTSMNIKIINNIDKRLEVNQLLDDVKTALANGKICETNFANVNPQADSGWPPGARKITNEDGTLVFLEEGKLAHGFTIAEISLAGFVPLHPLADPKEGSANLTLSFKNNNGVGVSDFQRTIKLRIGLKGSASPGSENEVASCNAISGAVSALPQCPVGNTLVSDGAKMTCSKDQGFSVPTHYERFPMLCQAPGPGLGTAFGNDCATIKAKIEDLNAQTKNAKDANNSNNGVLVYERDYTAKATGELRLHSRFNWSGTPQKLECAIQGAIFVDDGKGYKSVGWGELGNPFSDMGDVAKKTGDGFAGVPCPTCYVGFSGSAVGKVAVVAGQTYKIMVRAFRLVDGAVGNDIWLGTLKFDDVYAEGFLEVLEVSQ